MRIQMIAYVFSPKTSFSTPWSRSKMIKFESTCFARPHILCSLRLSFIESRQSHSTQNSGIHPLESILVSLSLGKQLKSLKASSRPSKNAGTVCQQICRWGYFDQWSDRIGAMGICSLPESLIIYHVHTILPGEGGRDDLKNCDASFTVNFAKCWKDEQRTRSACLL